MFPGEKLNKEQSPKTCVLKLFDQAYFLSVMQNVLFVSKKGHVNWLVAGELSSY